MNIFVIVKSLFRLAQRLTRFEIHEVGEKNFQWTCPFFLVIDPSKSRLYCIPFPFYMSTGQS
jgi:hypothetical protein